MNRQMETQEQNNRGTSQLSRLCAVFIVLCHAMEILIRKIEAMALRERLYMERENKQAVTGIIKACRMMEFHMSHISTWAMGAAVTDNGECGTIEAYDVLQQDASDACELVLWWTNASHADDAARIKTLSMLKLLTKEQPIIDPDIINSMKVKI